VRSKFLAKGHWGFLSLECDLVCLWRRVGIVASLEGTRAARHPTAPEDVNSVWNKGLAIWFPRWVGYCCNVSTEAWNRPIQSISGLCNVQGVALEEEVCMRRGCYPRLGGTRG
jgi:hypothetical protein